jgi:hypothetical protein
MDLGHSLESSLGRRWAVKPGLGVVFETEIQSISARIPIGEHKADSMRLHRQALAVVPSETLPSLLVNRGLALLLESHVCEPTVLVCRGDFEKLESSLIPNRRWRRSGRRI